MINIIKQLTFLISLSLFSCGTSDDVLPTLSEQDVLNLLDLDLQNGEGEVIINRNEAVIMNEKAFLRRYSSDSTYRFFASAPETQNSMGTLINIIIISFDNPPLTNGTCSMNELGGDLYFARALNDSFGNSIYHHYLGNNDGDLLLGNVTFTYLENEISISFNTNVSSNQGGNAPKINHLSGTITVRL